MTTTPTAASVPWFVTSRVNRTISPGTASLGSPRLTMAGSTCPMDESASLGAGVAVGVDVGVDVGVCVAVTVGVIPKRGASTGAASTKVL